MLLNKIEYHILKKRKGNVFSFVVSQTVQQKQRIMLQCKLFNRLEIIIIAVQKGPNNETF